MTETARRVVAFDNTGTLSEVVLSVAKVSADPVFDRRVPDIPADRPAALVGIATDDYRAFDVDGPLSAVIRERSIPVHLALANVETTASEARDALLRDEEAPARSVLEEVRSLEAELTAEFPTWGDLPIGVQLAMDLTAGRIHRIIAYTTVPHPTAASVLEAVTAAGWEVHVVSGDRAPILAAVTEALEIPTARVHADQSKQGKSETIRMLQTNGTDIVAMVGDYENDRLAFERADRSILIASDDADETTKTLSEIVDVVVPSLSGVPDVL